MRKGWDEGEVNAPELAKRVEGAGAAAIAVHGRTAKQSYSGFADWEVVASIARSVSIPVFGSGDCIEPSDIVDRMRAGVSGVFVGRGVLRNPWVLAQAQDLMANREPRIISRAERGRFLLDYMDLLLDDGHSESEGFRHVVTRDASRAPEAGNLTPALGRDRWVINKLRALCSWYTKGFEGGAALRTAVNSTQSLGQLRDHLHQFFLADEGAMASHEQALSHR
jgi:tRNA-dihydrouridine synthase